MSKKQEDLQHLLQVIDKGESKLKCAEGYLIQHICINKTCEASSGFCSNRSCEQCTARHSLCQCFRMDSLTQLLQNPSRQAHWLTKQVKKIQRKLKNIKFKIKDFRSEVCLSLLEEKEREVITAIYIGQNEFELNGQMASTLFHKLKKISSIIDTEVTPSLESEKKGLQNILSSLIEIERNIDHQLNLGHRIQLDAIRQKITPRQSNLIQQLKQKCKDLQELQQKGNEEAKIARDNLQHFKTTFNIRQEQLAKEINRLKREKEDEAAQCLSLRKEKQIAETKLNQNLSKINNLQHQLLAEGREQMRLKELLERERKQRDDISHKLKESQNQRNDAQRSFDQKNIQQLQSKIVTLEKRLRYKRKEEMQSNSSQPLVGLQFIFSLSTLDQIERVADKWKYHLLKSKIIPTNRIEELRFIYQSLKRPKNMQLLFRASEHGFLAKNFHHFCDNVSNTFTLLRTEFGKTIGAYTPLLMDSPEKPRFFTDHSNRSFLLSIDLWEKMNLKEENRAIKCNRNLGPIFGAGCDLAISDRCHLNNSFANFPWSYNSKSNYKCNQKTWTAFCGAPSGRHFKIIEYQVYKVKW